MTMRIDLRPLRRWWPVAAAVGSSILSSILAVVLLLAIQQRNAEQDRKAQEELARVQAQQKAALCGLVVLMDNAWRETPPATTSGHNLAAAIADARRILDCPAR